jgi:hypothetical protein
MRRRQLLTATAIGIAGIAGCSSSTDEAGTETSTGGPLATPTNTVRTLYDRLYGDNDVPGANDLYHPDSEAPSIEAEDFEPYGGLRSMGAEVRETEVVSESASETEVHATVYYSTPAGGAVNIDWFTLAPHEDQWLIMTWQPEAVR